MTGRWSLGFMVLVTSALALAACGGRFSGGGGDEGGQASGATGAVGTGAVGTGGGSTAGRGGATTRQDCTVDGKRYADGSTFSSGCNNCSCQDGVATCDARACDDGCTEGDKRYSVGETFAAGDLCNTCTCLTGGTVACTMKQCPSCAGAQAAYSAALLRARKCDPQRTEQCQAKLPAEAGCSCEVFVDGGNRSAIADAKAAAKLYSEGDCDEGLCPPCIDGPSRGYCSAAGLCEAFEDGLPRPCKVGNVIYPSGTSGIPDPTSCNQCSCDHGQLSCTNDDCPIECPAGRVEATQCAQCSLEDKCLIVEYGCLPTCDPDADTCKEGTCVDGACRNLCG